MGGGTSLQPSLVFEGAVAEVYCGGQQHHKADEEQNLATRLCFAGLRIILKVQNYMSSIRVLYEMLVNSSRMSAIA